MIRRLKRRMILLVLAGLLLASAGVVAAINLMNWQSLTQQAEAVLTQLEENGGKRPGAFNLTDGSFAVPSKLDGDEQPEDGFRGGFFSDDGAFTPPRRFFRDEKEDSMYAASLSNYFTVTLDEDGGVEEWTSERADLYTDADVAAMTKTAVSSGKNTGRVGSQFYRLTRQDGKRMLIFVDRSMEIQNAEDVLRLTVLVAVVEDAVLSAGAIWLICRMVKPVDEAMEKQKQFVWDASHELKTPLAVISANAEALSTEVGTNKPLEFIQSEVRRTDRLIQNLLTLARMEKGAAKAAHEKFDLSRAVLEVALPFESAVFEAGKTMEMNIPDGIMYTGDAEMIKQLAVILLSNAEKYSDDGGKITVSLEAKGDRRVLKVHNTGPAIPKEAQEKIFDRFYRVDSSHNREIEGNGLGLAIAQRIVSAHKGRITVHSAEGEGTAFTVVL